MDRVPSTLLVGPFLRLHQAIYQMSGGRLGKRLAGGAPALLLTTVGRKSGLERVNALSYLKDGDAWVVVASNGGSDRPPGWLANLKANPSVKVKEGPRLFDATARVASVSERERLWPLVNHNNRGLAPLLHPGARGRYDVYQRQTGREIPIVVLQPV
ncbi:MAG: nitroreductase family deazaflavin-dependent oxidoreductase [Acidimicrobiales bacterium]